jgi:hypothetical protein
VVRLTDVHQKTILKLLVLAGEKCERIMAQRVSNVKVRDIEMDEIWSFIGKRRSECGPMTIRTWATATPSSPYSATRSWF